LFGYRLSTVEKSDLFLLMDAGRVI